MTEKELLRGKREQQIFRVRREISKEIGRLSPRDLYLAGFFLYWTEGTRKTSGIVELSGTDSTKLQFFLEWLKLFDVPKSKIKVQLHLTLGVDEIKNIRDWSKKLSLPPSQFYKPCIKNRIRKETLCVVSVCDVELSKKILLGIQHLQEMTIPR